MRLMVLKLITLKKNGQTSPALPGQVVEVRDPRKAEPFIRAGYLKPIPTTDSVGQLLAVKLWSEVIQDEIWVAIHPDNLINGPREPVIYLPEEIQSHNQCAPLEVIRRIHNAKRRMRTRVIIVNRVGEA